MDVLVIEVVLAAGRAQGIEAENVEDRTQVRVERIVALAGPDPDAAVQVVDRGVGQAVVVGGVAGRGGADHVGRRQQVAAEHHARWVLVADPAHRDRVRLRPVPAQVLRSVEGDPLGQDASRHVRRVVEERRRIDRRGAESEGEGHVAPAIPDVVDVELVTDVIAESIEVRAARRILERHVVRHEDHVVRVVGGLKDV